MKADEIKPLLEHLAAMRAERYALEAEQAAVRDSVLTEEIRAKLAEIDEEFGAKLEALDATLAELEAAAKSAVVEVGASVRVAGLQAVWYRGQSRWDSKALDSYAQSHPDVLQYKKTSAPYVVLRDARSQGGEPRDE